MSQTVLITGAAGFIGSHLAERLLDDGLRVVGIDNFSPFYDRKLKEANLSGPISRGGGFRLIEADICDKESVASAIAETAPDTIVHLAAMAGVRPSIENPLRYTEVNVNGTVNLLESAVRAGVKKFLFASSSSVYGNNKKTPFAEQDRVDEPISPYAATKRSAELLCHTYWRLHGMPTTCLRFFTVYGPRQRPDLAISKFLRAVSTGAPVTVFGDGTSSRDYTYIDDIVDGVVAAVKCCEGFNIFNLGGNQPISLSGLLEQIEVCVGRKAVIERLPMQSGDVERTYADLTNSKIALGYEPKTSLSEGLARQWDWLRSQGP